MKEELILRGISAKRISFESLGTNTRAQAINIFKGISNIAPSPKGEGVGGRGILIVTSPEHLYRAVLTFRKAGFRMVEGLPAFETAIESELSFDDNLLGGKKWLPAIGKNITLRYQFWSQLHYEELVIREWLAIAFYKLNGWI